MSEPTKALRRTDEFLRQLRERPLWAFAWSVFVASVAFSLRTLLAIGEQNALITQSNSIAQQYASNAHKTAMLTETMTKIWSAAVEAEVYFANRVEPGAREAAVAGATIERALGLLEEARGGIDAELAIVSTLQLQDETLGPFVHGFKEDLVILDGVLKEKESVCTLMRERRFVEALERLRELDSGDQHERRRQLETANARVQEFQDIVRQKGLEYQAVLGTLRARMATYRRDVYVSIAAAFYAGVFGAFAFLKWRRGASGKT